MTQPRSHPRPQVCQWCPFPTCLAADKRVEGCMCAARPGWPDTPVAERVCCTGCAGYQASASALQGAAAGQGPAVQPDSCPDSPQAQQPGSSPCPPPVPRLHLPVPVTPAPSSASRLSCSARAPASSSRRWVGTGGPGGAVHSEPMHVWVPPLTGAEADCTPLQKDILRIK